MLGHSHSAVLFATGAIVLASWFPVAVAKAAAPPTEKGPVFTLTSTTFKDGGMMPRRTAYKSNAEFPYCFGENISPQLSWSNPRPGVTSYVLTMNALNTRIWSFMAFPPM